MMRVISAAVRTGNDAHYGGQWPENDQPIQDAGITVKILGTIFRPLIVTTTTGRMCVAIVVRCCPALPPGVRPFDSRTAPANTRRNCGRIIHSAEGEAILAD